MASVSDDHLHCAVHFTETLFLNTRALCIECGIVPHSCKEHCLKYCLDWTPLHCMNCSVFAVLRTFLSLQKHNSIIWETDFQYFLTITLKHVKCQVSMLLGLCLIQCLILKSSVSVVGLSLTKLYLLSFGLGLEWNFQQFLERS